jgi:hypothetical protein
MRDSIREYFPDWSAWSELIEATGIRLRLDEMYDVHQDRNGEHYRYAVILAYIRGNRPLSSTATAKILQLVFCEADFSCKCSMLIQMINETAPGNEWWEHVSLPDDRAGAIRRACERWRTVTQEPAINIGRDP